MDNKQKSTISLNNQFNGGNTITNLNLKKFQESISIDAGAKRLNDIIEKKNIKFQKTSEKFKTYIDSIKKNSKNIDMMYEKRKELNKILFRKLLPISTSIEEESFNNSPNLLGSYNSLSYQISNSRENFIKTTVGSNSIINANENTKTNRKQIVLPMTIHPSFHSFLTNLKEKQRFKQNFYYLESPLIKEIERLYERVINDEGIDIDGVSIVNLNDFDVHRNIDQIDIKDIFTREGPLKAKSRYWKNSEYKWRECVVLKYEENSLFSVIWDDEFNSLHCEISSEFENFKKKHLIKKKTNVQDKITLEDEEEDEEEEEDKNIKENWNLDYESYQNFVKEILEKLSKRFEFKRKQVSRINVCFEFDNFDDHLMRFKDAVRAKIIYDYQSVYFKKLSLLYKNEINLMLRSNILSQGILLKRLNHFKKISPIEDIVKKEVISFTKLSLCKADYLITQNKIHKIFNYKPWEEENIKKLNFKQKIKFLLLYLICKHKNIKPLQFDDLYLTSGNTNNDENNLIIETSSINQSLNLNLNEHIKLLISEYTVMNLSINAMPNILIPGEDYFIGKYKHKKFKEEIAYVMNNMKNYQSSYNDFKIITEQNINQFNLYRVILNNKRIILNNSLILFDKRILRCIKKIKNIENIYLFENLKSIRIFSSEENTFINNLSLIFSEPIKRISDIMEEIFLVMHNEVYFNDKINVKDKIYLNYAEKFDKIYNLFFKQISSFSQISLNQSCRKIKEMKNNIFNYIPFDKELKELISNLPEFEKVKNYIFSYIDEDIRDLSFNFYTHLYKLVNFYKKKFTDVTENQRNRRKTTIKFAEMDKKLELLNYMILIIDKFNYSQSLYEGILRRISPSIKNLENCFKIVNITLKKSSYKDDKKTNNKINFLINDIFLNIEEFYKKCREKLNKIENSFLMPQIKKIELREICMKGKELTKSDIEMVKELFDIYYIEFSPSKNEIEQTLKLIIDQFTNNLKKLEFDKPIFPLSFAKKLLLKENFRPEPIKSNKKIKENMDKKNQKMKNSGKVIKSLEHPKLSQEKSLYQYKIFECDEKLTEKIYSEVQRPILDILEISFIGVYAYSSFFIYYIPFYIYREDLIKQFIEKNLENNDLQFFDFFITCIKRLIQDIDLFKDCIECGIVSFDIKFFKEEVKNNLEKTMDSVLKFFRRKIKQIIEEGEKVYIELKEKMNVQADCVDNYIDLSDFLNSDELSQNIENLKEIYIRCEGLLQILEGNFSPLEIKQIVIFLNSYTWSKEISFIKNQKESELNKERHILIDQLKQESIELYELIERLEGDVMKFDSMKNFEKSDEYEIVYINLNSFVRNFLTISALLIGDVKN